MRKCTYAHVPCAHMRGVYACPCRVILSMSFVCLRVEGKLLSVEFVCAGAWMFYRCGTWVLASLYWLASLYLCGTWVLACVCMRGCLCIDVCVCVCIAHTHMHAYMHAYTRARAHTHTHTHTHMYVCRCEYVNVNVNAHIHV